jgi:hypothetical protein
MLQERVLAHRGGAKYDPLCRVLYGNCCAAKNHSGTTKRVRSPWLLHYASATLSKALSRGSSESEQTAYKGKRCPPVSFPQLSLSGSERNRFGTIKREPRVPNRCKPAKTGLEMQKAESGHARLSVLTG